MSLTPRGDWLKWVAAGCALVATASAEYELARAIGMHPWIAAAVPGALDAYAVRALRAHREVLTAVLAMVGVNAASHLVTAGVLAVDWRLITAVSAIAPLVLWRVHALGTPGEARVRAIWGEHAASTEPDPEHGRGNEDQGTPGEREHPEHAAVSVPPLPVRVPVTWPPADGFETCPWCDWDECPRGLLEGHQRDACANRFEHTRTFNEHAEEAVSVASTNGPWVGTHPFPYEWDEHTTSTPVLRLVPHLPDGFTPTDTPVPDFGPGVLAAGTPSTDGSEHVSTGVLTTYDVTFLERARVLAGQTQSVPGVRALKSELSTGTARAQRLVAALTIEHKRAQKEERP